MEKVHVEAVENSIQPAAVMRQLTGPLGTTDLAVNYYELDPGDSFSFAYHSHEIQEEVKLRNCSDCGERTDNRLEAAEDEPAVVAVCRECGAETGRWVEGSMDGEVP